MGHLVNTFLALALVCMVVGFTEGRHVNRAEVVYRLPEEYERAYSDSGMYSEGADFGSTVDSYSLSPCEGSEDGCHENASEGVSDDYFGGDSSSSMPF